MRKAKHDSFNEPASIRKGSFNETDSFGSHSKFSLNDAVQ